MIVFNIANILLICSKNEKILSDYLISYNFKQDFFFGLCDLE